MLALLAFDLWLFGFRYHPFQQRGEVYRPDEAIEHLVATAAPRPRFVRVHQYWIQVNGALAHGLYDVQGYDNFIPRRYVDLISLVEDQHENAQAFNVVYNLSDPSLAEDPVLDLLGVRYVAGRTEMKELGTPETEDGFGLFRQPGALPPAFLVHCWTWLSEEATIDRLASMGSAAFEREVVLQSPAGGAPRPGPSGECEPAREAALELYEPERVVLSASTDRESMLVLTDTWDPGWRATVDGEATPILRADHALRAIRLGPGEHRIVLTFEPAWLIPGAVASLLAVAVTVLWAAFLSGWVSRRLRSGPDPA